jgi:hypothetical protein
MTTLTEEHPVVFSAPTRSTLCAMDFLLFILDVTEQHYLNPGNL